MIVFFLRKKLLELQPPLVSPFPLYFLFSIMLDTYLQTASSTPPKLFLKVQSTFGLFFLFTSSVFSCPVHLIVKQWFYTIYLIPLLNICHLRPGQIFSSLFSPGFLSFIRVRLGRHLGSKWLDWWPPRSFLRPVSQEL